MKIIERVVSVVSWAPNRGHVIPFLIAIAVDDHLTIGFSLALRRTPSWVIFRPRAALELGPFIPQQQTCGDRIGLSVPCQNPTSWLMHCLWFSFRGHLLASAKANLLL